MENNEEQNVIDKAKEAMIAAEEASKLAANIASGNFIGAAKNAVHLLKNKEFKKKLKKKIIMSLLKCMIPVIIAVCLLCGIMAIKDTMVGLLANAGTAISGFLSEAWQWMTNDYWIKLDEKIEYTIDADTGETLGTPTTITDEDLKDENGNQRNTTTESYTIVDKYIKELGNQGLSLKALRLLGDADYSDEEKLLENEDNKTLVEKYISEFIRADIITQQPHKNRTEELVNAKNQNWVDGGVYFYRTKKEPTINEEDFVNGSYNQEDVEVTDKDYKQMEFMNYDEFMEKLAKNDKNLRYRFTIDKETGDLILVEIKTVTEATSMIPTDMGWFNEIAGWFNMQFKTTTTYELKEVRIPYKEYIAKYAMPYEFLINLCEITQNPEFVYHVALLARDTKIILAVQDNVTMTRETEEVLEEKTSYENYSGPSVEGASETSKKNEKTRTVKVTTVQTPVLRVEYADTWSFYEEFEFTKNVTGELEESGPNVVEYHPSGDILSHVEEYTYTSYEASDGAYEGVGVEKTVPEHWEGTFTTRTETSTQVITTTTTYNEAILKNSVEKSKQFLGLLRNDTGKCEYDCSNETVSLKYDPTALECAQKAEFNKNGINVQYRIPNMTRTESPLNKLTSGIQMLYAALQSNSSGYKEEDKLLNDENINESYDIQQQYIADKDYESAYVVKMQGLAEHMRYLMTFPENESYTIKDLLLDTIFGDDDEEDDEEDENYIPKYTWNGTTSELIEMLGKYAHQDMQESGILASVTVAQALLESGWGKSQLSATYNNYFGIKKGSGWTGPTVTMPTKEVINGQTITIKAEFRVYDSPLESLKNHSSILSNSRYSGVKGETDYRKAITIIKNGGYATDPNYVNKICQIIEQYGLTRFD